MEVIDCYQYKSSIDYDRLLAHFQPVISSADCRLGTVQNNPFDVISSLFGEGLGIPIMIKHPNTLSLYIYVNIIYIHNNKYIYIYDVQIICIYGILNSSISFNNQWPKPATPPVFLVEFLKGHIGTFLLPRFASSRGHHDPRLVSYGSWISKGIWLTFRWGIMAQEIRLELSVVW